MASELAYRIVYELICNHGLCGQTDLLRDTMPKQYQLAGSTHGRPKVCHLVRAKYWQFYNIWCLLCCFVSELLLQLLRCIINTDQCR